MLRRPLSAVFVPLALVVPLASAGDLGHAEAPARKTTRARPSATAVPAPLSFHRAARRGQPIAILRRATVLRAAPGGRRLARLARRTEFGTPRVLAATRERRGWLRVLASELPNGRRGWIPASAASIEASPWRVIADLSSKRATVTRDGRVVRRFAVGIGSPRTPTPTGRFAVTDKLHYSGGGSAAYGWGVLALTGHQPHIEPGWNGGDRLAIHGTGSPATIGRAASFGCLRASESDVRWIVTHVWLGSIVEIRS